MCERFHSGRAALLRGLNFWRRGSAALPLIVMNLLVAVCATAATTNTLSDAEIQGRQLAQQLLAERPAEDFTNTGVLKIRDAKGKRSEIPVKCEVVVTATNWLSRYEAKFGSNITDVTTLVVTRCDAELNHYVLFENEKTARVGGSASIHIGMGVSGNRTMIPFAGSDFWVADLGLEFFHWPEQKVLKHELRRSRACTVLESTNPNPFKDGYLRVVSWIDNESGGIVHAEAYDANGKLLKEFNPKSFKKVNGQWELEGMEIRNVQIGSRTQLEFDLKVP
ncbi:MAG: outer membrane lipoprotein-sorting protein [Verrucomicrobiota bacterium]